MKITRPGPIAVACATAALLALAGCSNSPNNADTTSGGSSEGGGDVVTFASTASEKAAVEKIAEVFTEKTGTKVELTIADTDNYQTTLRTQLASGTAPDIFFAWPGDGNPMAMDVLAEADLLADLSDMAFVQNVPEGIRPVTQIDGKTYIAPLNMSMIGPVYNMTEVEKLGLSVPQTWDEVLTFCADARAAGKAAYSLAAATGWQTQLIPFALASTLVYEANPDFSTQMNEGKVTFASSPWVDVMAKNLEMADAGCFQDNYLGTTYEEALKLLSSGDALASVQVSSSLTAVLDGAPEGSTFEFQPLPANNDAAKTFIPAAAGGSYGINASAKNPDGAHALLEFLTSEEGSAIYTELTASVNALPAGDIELNPALDPMIEKIDAGQTYPFMDQQWPNPNVQQTLFEITQQILAGSTSPEDGLKRMDQAFAEG